MVGQRDPSDRYTAKDMLDGLKEMAENGRFSSLSKKEYAEWFLEE